MGRLFVFSAPSGGGKSTIVDRLRKAIPSLGYAVSHTTRVPRKDETNGIHYHFVDKETFRNMAEAGQFVEWAEVYGNLYGTSFASLDQETAKGHDVVLDIDSQGAKNIRRHFADSVLVYILPPSLDTLKERLKARGTEDEQTLNLRMQKARDEMKDAVFYDFVIVNEDLEAAIMQARSIIISDQCRISRRKDILTALIGESIR